MPNVLDSLYLGPGPEQRVKEASINSFKATFVMGESYKSSQNSGGKEILWLATLSGGVTPLSVRTVDLIHQTSPSN